MGLFSKKTVRKNVGAGGEFIIEPMTLEQIDLVSDVLPDIIELMSVDIIPLIDSIKSGTPDFDVLSKVLKTDIPSFADFISRATGINEDKLMNLNSAEFLNILASIYEVNTDFFFHASMPALNRVMVAMTGPKQ